MTLQKEDHENSMSSSENSHDDKHDKSDHDTANNEHKYA